jgi:PHP family Zn ribbon phosphoesterase
MLSDFVVELHSHTVLSPCAAVEMIPPLIVRTALEKGLRVLAVTDHNASANVSAVQQAAAGTGLVIVPGMELQTREEVHLLCLFERLDQLEAWQARVDACLPDQPNVPDFFGEQFVVDATGDFIRSEPRLLLTSAQISLEAAVSEVMALGGLAIPAHVDRQAFGLLAQLGFVPAGLWVPALEISRYVTPEVAHRRFPQLAGHTLIQSGDAHSLDGYLGATVLRMAAPTVAEVGLALRGAGGRSVRLAAGIDNRQPTT